MKQTLLKIELPKGVTLRGADFREMLAKETNMPESFFHYENGRPKNGDKGDVLQISALPKFCIVSGAQWVGVLAQPGNADLLKTVVGDAIQLVSRQTNAICKAGLQDLVFGCGESAIPATYWVREMVLKRRHAASRAESVENLVAQRIKAGLARYAAAYGIILPSEKTMDLRVTACERPRGLAIRTTSGTTKEFATLVDVEFKAFVDLKGMWMLGNLTARGYGRVGYYKVNTPSTLGVIK